MRKVLTMYSAVSFLAIVFLGFKVFENNQENAILRTKGIIIEDQYGNDRILIGAPVPYSKHRVRTDTNKIKKVNGEKFYDLIKPYYNTYDYDAYGMIIMDSIGIERLIVGSPTTDLIHGKRIAPSTGIQINDSTGTERSGYGMMTVNGKDRVVFGMDNKNGSEGLMLFIIDDITGVLLNDHQGRIFLGKSDSAYYTTEGIVPFKGLMIKDSLEIKHLLNSHNKYTIRKLD